MRRDVDSGCLRFAGSPRFGWVSNDPCREGERMRAGRGTRIDVHMEPDLPPIDTLRGPGKRSGLLEVSPGGAQRLPAVPELDAQLRVRVVPAGPVAGAPPLVPAGVDDRHGLVRHLGRNRVLGRGVRLERAALPDLVPDRRVLRRSVARAGDDAPAGQDAIRLRGRDQRPVCRPDHAALAGQAPVRRCRRAADGGVRDRGRIRDRDRDRDLPGDGALAPDRRDPDHRRFDRRRAARSVGAARGTRVCARQQRHPGRRADARLRPPAHAAVQHHRLVRAGVGRPLQHLRVHAQEAPDPLRPGPLPGRGPVSS